MFVFDSVAVHRIDGASSWIAIDQVQMEVESFCAFETLRLAGEMSIRNELLDVARSEALEEIQSKYRPTNSLARRLVTLVGDEDETIQGRAIWLLKQMARNQFRFKPEHLIVLFGSLAELTHWLSKLHVCQMLQYVDIPEESASNLVWFLERNLLDENRFLRAWSYNGFYELAKQHSRYIDYAIEQLERGEMEKAASVKARIRNVRIAMNKLQTRKTKA